MNGPYYVIVEDSDKLDLNDVCDAVVSLGAYFDNEVAAREDIKAFEEDDRATPVRLFKLSAEEVKL